jgi:hypothetical protein
MPQRRRGSSSRSDAKLRRRLLAELSTVADAKLGEDDADPRPGGPFGKIEALSDVGRSEAIDQVLRDLEIGALQVAYFHTLTVAQLRLSVGQVVPVGLVEELFRQLKLSQMLTCVTVAVEEPEQSRPWGSVSDGAWSHPEGGEILIGDLRTQFLKKSVRIADPGQKLLRVVDAGREL